MKRLELTADKNGARLDRFLATRVPGATRAHCRRLIERGLVRVGGTLRPADHRLRAGDAVTVDPETAGWAEVPFEDWVLHEDAAILVLDKPSGLLMHPLGESWLARREAAFAEPCPNLAGLLQAHRPQIARAGVERCGIVHRLDRDTSGVLVVAKTPAAHERLVAAFRDRRVGKTYKAIVLGAVSRERLSVDAPVGRNPGRRRIQVSPFGRAAKTSFRVVGRGKAASSIEASPVTGRTHQIRVHLAALGHPVLGDPEWVRAPELVRSRESGVPEPPRMMLHAWKLVLPHPLTGRTARFAAPVPADFKAYWKSVS